MRRLQFLLRCLAGAAVVIALMLLAWQCIDIYMDGNAPDNLDPNGVYIVSVYRMADVAERLHAIALPLVICVAVVIVSIVLHLVFPVEDKKHPPITSDNRLRLMRARISQLPADAVAEERRRRVILAISAVLIALCGAVCLVYLLNQENFTSCDMERVMGEMMLHVSPWVVAAFMFGAVASMLCKASVQRELQLLKGVPADKKPAAPVPQKTHIVWIRAGILAIAILFIVLGAMNGGLRDVLVKAINICTECIGLG